MRLLVLDTAQKCHPMSRPVPKVEDFDTGRFPLSSLDVESPKLPSNCLLGNKPFRLRLQSLGPLTLATLGEGLPPLVLRGSKLIRPFLFINLLAWNPREADPNLHGYQCT